MKDFYDVYSSTITESIEDLPTIYCDMDMVLCDFLKSAEKVLGKPFPKADRTTRWPMISGTKNFWADLDWMPGSKRLWQFIDKYDAHILSAYSTKDANSRKGKMDWLRKSDSCRTNLLVQIKARYITKSKRVKNQPSRSDAPVMARSAKPHLKRIFSCYIQYIA